MLNKQDAHNLRIGLFAIAAIVTGLAGGADQGWAKHKSKTQPSTSSDPCADPTTFVENKIAKIRDLRQSLSTSSSDSISAWFEGPKKGVDQDKIAQISELRRDADSVNDMLRAGGCKTIDIDRELAKPAT